MSRIDRSSRPQLWAPLLHSQRAAPQRIWRQAQTNRQADRNADTDMHARVCMQGWRAGAKRCGGWLCVKRGCAARLGADSPMMLKMSVKMAMITYMSAGAGVRRGVGGWSLRCSPDACMAAMA